LDCGCGSGMSLLRILKDAKPKQVWAFDASESQIAAARGMDSKQAEIEWFVGTFDNFLEKKPEMKGAVDIIISNAALQFAPDLKHFFSTAATVLKPGGHIWAMWPAATPMGFVLRKVQVDERFAQFTKDIVVDERQPNGVRVPGQDTHHRLRQTFQGLGDKFERDFVAKVWMTVNHGTRDAVKKFVAGINPARSLIPDELKPEFDEFCLAEIQKLGKLEGGTMTGPMFMVRARLKEVAQDKSLQAQG